MLLSQTFTNLRVNDATYKFPFNGKECENIKLSIEREKKFYLNALKILDLFFRKKKYSDLGFERFEIRKKNEKKCENHLLNEMKIQAENGNIN